MSADDMMIQQATKGRISQGKSKQGDAPDQITITVTGKFAYELQQFLEEEAAKGGDYLRVRFLVLLAERLRMGVIQAREGEARKQAGR